MFRLAGNRNQAYHVLHTDHMGATWLRRGLRNLRCMPRCS